MSRFASLPEHDESSEEGETSEDLYQYTEQEILDMFRNTPAPQIPSSMTNFAHFFVEETLKPEILKFKPPMTGINSQFSLNVAKNPNKSFKSSKTPAKQKKTQVASPVPEETQWFYLDNMNHEVGPYIAPKMRRWYAQKYFDGSLLVRTASKPGEYKQVSELFPMRKTAFPSTTTASQSASEACDGDTEPHVVLFSLSDADLDFQDLWNL